MKKTEIKIEQKNKEKSDKLKAITLYENSIKSIDKESSELLLEIENFNNEINLKKEEYTKLKNSFNHGVLNSILKLISFGIIDLKK